MSELEQEILRATRTGRPFAVAMLDLDGLKAANDRFGHDWGDQLLKAVADVLQGDIRVTDVAARFGGDEFVLMLPETDLNGAILVADKVRVDISRIALPHNDAVVRTSVSIGIVTFPDDGRSSAELMRRADLAMYEAKRRGRDQIVRFAREGAAPLAQAGIVAAPSAAQSPRAPDTATQRAAASADAQAEPVRVPIEIEIQATVPSAPREPEPAAQPPVAARPGAGADAAQSVPAASTGPAPWERR